MQEATRLKYYLYSFSNLLAALGGGMILARGVDAINLPYLKGGSILAFFIGSSLGLGFLKIIPKKYSAHLSLSFSFLTALTSIVILLVFNEFSRQGKLDSTQALIFFALLCIRFGFWFYARVLRASAVAGQKQRIAWVELGYYVGMILGLILWKILGFNISMVYALLVDAILQFSAGVLDKVGAIFSSSMASSETTQAYLPLSQKDRSLSILDWRLTISIVLLTVGAQVIIFNLAHQVSDSFSSYILASYYIGVSIAAVMFKKFKIQFGWQLDSKFNFAIIKFTRVIQRKYSLLSFNFISSLSGIIVILGVLHWNWVISSNIEKFILLFFVSISAFFYEIVALCLLDRIGFHEMNYYPKKMVMRAYGMMAIAASVSLWVLGIAGSSALNLIGVMLLCFILSSSTVLKNADSN